MEKTFSSLKPLVDVDGKSKFCLKCGSKATKEALFDVEGAMLLEKYCDACAETEVK
jgi:predicted nucleic-acid-binding Zn-ribbon protein